MYRTISPGIEELVTRSKLTKEGLDASTINTLREEMEREPADCPRPDPWVQRRPGTKRDRPTYAVRRSARARNGKLSSIW
jgi:hypothetical protein